LGINYRWKNSIYCGTIHKKDGQNNIYEVRNYHVFEKGKLGYKGQCSKSSLGVLSNTMAIIPIYDSDSDEDLIKYNDVIDIYHNLSLKRISNFESFPCTIPSMPVDGLYVYDEEKEIWVDISDLTTPWGI